MNTSKPVHISEVLPGVMTDSEARMQRQQEQDDQQRRVFNALGDFQRRGRPALRAKRGWDKGQQGTLFPVQLENQA